MMISATALPPMRFAAVDPAHHFTGGVGAADRLLVNVQHFAIGVNGHAAHGVVHPGGDANGMERAFVNRRAQPVVRPNCSSCCFSTAPL